MTTTREQTTVTVPRDLFDAIAAIAKRQHRSARGQILHLMAQAIEADNAQAASNQPPAIATAIANRSNNNGN